MIKQLFFLLSVLLVVEISTAAGTPPQISNFKIEDSQPNRIYFDSTKPITGSTVEGFDLKDKEGISITSVSINSGQMSGHYFSVSSSFSWYHNNTLMYVGGSDIQSESGERLRSFSLQYIQNNISIPKTTGREYYVNLDGDNSNDGLNEFSAFRTIQKGINKLHAGDKLWIKAGNYGAENLKIISGGTARNPIQIEGYKNSIGDITSPYYDYGNQNGGIDGNEPFLASEMPLLDADNRRGGGNAISIERNNSFIIIKNIQVQNYQNGVLMDAYTHQLVLNNVMGKNMGVANNYGIVFHLDAYKQNNYLRIIDCVAINGSGNNFQIEGENILIEGSKAYCDIGNAYGNIGEPTDYYYLIQGANNIVRNSLAKRVSIGHGAHAFSLKYASEYTLIENCKTINTQWSFQARHSAVHHNVFRDCESRANVPFRFVNGGTVETAAINVTNGSHHNIFENIYAHDLDAVFIFDKNLEDNANSSGIGHDNVFKNIVADNIRLTGFLFLNWEPNTASFYNNKFYNITFNNIQGTLFNIDDHYGQVSMSGNEFANCIFVGVSSLDVNNTYHRRLKNSEFSWDTNNFFNSFSSQGDNPMSVDPKFINPSSGDFRLQSNSECIDVGLTLDEVTTDFDMLPRAQGAGHDIGAFEFQNETETSEDVYAGEDVALCDGSSVTLTATGTGNDFSWSNGETTQSITVSPTETTTYTVTLTNDGSSTTDSVVVTVNESPTADAGSDVSICGGETVLTASGGDSYEWNTGETTQSITVGPTETTTYTVITTNNGCSETAEDEVVVTVNLTLDLDAGTDVEICSGNSITLTATGAENYEWSTGETTASITVNPEDTTSYTVSSSNDECSVSDQVIVTVNDLPTVNAGEDVSICSGEEIVLMANGTGNYVWSTGETTNRITVNPASTTTYTVTASGSCDGGDVSDEIIVTVNSLPVVNAGDDVTITNGLSTTLTATGEGDFLWSTGETGESITVSPSETTTYAVSVASEGGCSSTDNIKVIVEDLPVEANAGSDVEICKNSNVTLTASGGGNYLWNTGATTKNITVSPSQTRTYSVIVSNATSSDTDEVIVTVNNLPSISAGDDATITNGSSITLTATGNGNFLWSTGESTQSISVSPSETTTYTVSTTSSAGCSNEDKVTVVVENNQIVANAGEDVEICKDSNTILTASGGENYLWSTGETTQSITVAPSETSTYSVTVTSDVSLDTDEVIVTVDQTCSGISNRLIQKKALVYPNPTHGVLNIQMKGYSEDIKVSIFNLNGNLLFSETISNYSSEKNMNRKLDLSQYRKGIYFVRIENQQKVQTQKIIVN